MTPEITCCFSGHRPSRLPWGTQEDDPRCRALVARLEVAIADAYAAGYRHFLCGMAQGADLYFCEGVLRLREAHPEVTVEAAVPFAGQADHWPEEDRQRRQALLDQCNYETVIQHTYTAGCMHRRNRYMVDRSSLLIAVYDGIPRGGTMNTLSYAMRKGVDTVILDVETTQKPPLCKGRWPGGAGSEGL